MPISNPLKAATAACSKTLVAAAAAGCLALSGVMAFAPAAAAAQFNEEKPFSEQAFVAAQKAGKPILVHITASWCTTCAAQKPILDRLHGEPEFKPLEIFNIDFDNQKALVHKFGARMQSTLIVFKGGKEEGRSAGQTDPQAIKALLAKAV